MRRVLSLGMLAMFAVTLPAWAENFTGAYAGVNAGYAFERERGSKKPGVPSNDSPVPAPASNDLPPSATVAVKSLQQRPATAR